MPTMEDYGKQPRDRRVERLRRTADELAAAIAGRSNAVLSRRPDARSWAPKEIVCHLRDTEEVFGARIQQILAMDLEPTLVVTDPDRWAEERQYLTNDAGVALAAFRRRRTEALEKFATLTPAEWEKGALHPLLGSITLDGFLSAMAAHDDDHLAQLARALQGSA